MATSSPGPRVNVPAKQEEARLCLQQAGYDYEARDMVMLFLQVSIFDIYLGGRGNPNKSLLMS